MSNRVDTSVVDHQTYKPMYGLPQRTKDLIRQTDQKNSKKKKQKARSYVASATGPWLPSLWDHLVGKDDVDVDMSDNTFRYIIIHNLG